MSTIKEFNKKLNESIKDNKEITNIKEQVDLILKSTMDHVSKKESVLIIGAGRMNDFSLRFLLEEFKHITLTDVDIVSINSALNEMPIRKKDLKRIDVVELEYTGFSKYEFFEDLKELVLRARTFDDIDQILEAKIDKIKEYKFLEGKTYDLIYVSPIYSQLVYQQLLRECSHLRISNYPEHMLKYIENKMLDEMIGVIDRFNENIVSLLDEGGRLIVLSDIFQLNVDSMFEIRVRNGIKNKIVMDEIYEGYKQKYGMGLGDYGLYNLDELLISEVTRWMLWHFTENYRFAIKLKVYRKLNI